MKFPVKIVTVAQRFRKDLGDLSALKKSMTELGLLQPIGITSSDRLVFGERRLAAAKELGWKDIEARVVDLDNPLLAEFDENECRKPFTLTERAAIADAIEAAEAERAKGRMEAGVRPSENFTEGKGEAKAKAAAAVGMSRPTLAKVQKVIAAAAEDPDLAPIVEEMDRTGKVDPAYKKVTVKIETPTAHKPAFDDRVIVELICKLTKALDDRQRLGDPTAPKSHLACMVAMDKVREEFRDWQNATE